MENSQSPPTSNHLLAKDRFGNLEYLVDQKDYYYIMDLIRFYHDSIYMLPDDEVIHVEKIDGNEHTSTCDVPVNQLIFG